MVALSEIVEFISKISHLISDVIIFILELSFLVGQTLVNQFVIVLDFSKQIFLLISSLVLVIYEDSNFFIQDIKESAVHFSNFITNGIDCLTHGFMQLASAISHGVINLTYLIFGIVNNISQIFLSATSLSKGFIRFIGKAFLLIGSSIWLAVSNTYEVIIYLIIQLPKLIFIVLEGIKNFYLSLNCAAYNIICVYLKSACNLPHDSFFGLLFGAVILYIVSRKWSEIFLMVSYISKSICYYVVLLTKILWTNIFKKKIRQNVSKNNILYNSLDEQIEDRLCVVCKDNFREILIFPCRHVCLCAECCLHIKSNQRLCPVCRTYIKSKMKVYI